MIMIYWLNTVNTWSKQEIFEFFLFTAKSEESSIFFLPDIWIHANFNIVFVGNWYKVSYQVENSISRYKIACLKYEFVKVRLSKNYFSWSFPSLTSIIQRSGLLLALHIMSQFSYSIEVTLSLISVFGKTSFIRSQTFE